MYSTGRCIELKSMHTQWKSLQGFEDFHIHGMLYLLQILFCLHLRFFPLLWIFGKIYFKHHMFPMQIFRLTLGYFLVDKFSMMVHGLRFCLCSALTKDLGWAYFLQENLHFVTKKKQNYQNMFGIICSNNKSLYWSIYNVSFNKMYVYNVCWKVLSMLMTERAETSLTLQLNGSMDSELQNEHLKQLDATKLFGLIWSNGWYNKVMLHIGLY